MTTVELMDVLANIPADNKQNPSLVCVENGILTSRLLLQTLPERINLDDVENTGLYGLSANATSMPSNLTSTACILKVYRWNKNRIYQVLFRLTDIYARTKLEEWTPWLKVETRSLT